MFAQYIFGYLLFCLKIYTKLKFNTLSFNKYLKNLIYKYTKRY